MENLVVILLFMADTDYDWADGRPAQKGKANLILKIFTFWLLCNKTSNVGLIQLLFLLTSIIKNLLWIQNSFQPSKSLKNIFKLFKEFKNILIINLFIKNVRVLYQKYP